MLLQDLKIGNKLLLINLVAAGSAMILLMVCIALIALISNRANLINNLDNQAHILGENLTASIAFNDKKSAQSLLEALRWSPDIQQVVVLDSKGQAFSSYPPHAKINLNKKDTFWNRLSSVRTQQSINISNQKVGEIHMSASLYHIYTQLGTFLLFTLVAMLLAITLSAFMLRRLQTYLTNPIIELTNYMRRVSSTNNYALRFDLTSKDELGELAAGFNIMLDTIQSHEASLDSELILRKQAEDRLEKMAFYDEVTKLPNRHYFNEKMRNAVAASTRHNTLCCIILIDLDDFKIVNDTLGHHVGDSLLFEVGQRLNHGLRTSDVLCRIGGDEFALILENLSSADQASLVAQKIINTLSLPFLLNNKEIFIGASIGISLCPQDSTDIPTLLRNADSAMYSVKGRGKNNFQIFLPEMESKNLQRFSLENGLRQALHQNELFLHYQPQIDLSSNKTIGFEALLRWKNPTLGSVSPVDFIPIAEETGLIIPIGEFVLHTACVQAQQWRERHATDIAISVNLSGRQLSLPDIAERILNIVESTKLPFHLLNIELTESILMGYSEETLNKLEKLHQSGFTISIDDFGTGYSSMSYLKRYPIDTLKIDRSFVSDLPHDTNDVAITQAIIALGKNLGMKLVAEGVETEAQLDFLKAHGCDMVQGYLLGRPTSAELAELYIASENNNESIIGDSEPVTK